MEPLRQPRTFWQWLTHQEGNLYVPNPRGTDALQAIERQLVRLHKELDSHTTTGGPGYASVIGAINKLNDELVRRSKEESTV